MGGLLSVTHPMATIRIAKTIDLRTRTPSHISQMFEYLPIEKQWILREHELNSTERMYIIKYLIQRHLKLKREPTPNFLEKKKRIGITAQPSQRLKGKGTWSAKMHSSKIQRKIFWWGPLSHNIFQPERKFFFLHKQHITRSSTQRAIKVNHACMYGSKAVRATISINLVLYDFSPNLGIDSPRTIQFRFQTPKIIMAFII